MQGIILVGGQGTRLRELYADRPKALVPILHRAFLEWQVDWLNRAGIRDLHLSAGYRAEMLVDWARAHASESLRITVSAEPKPLGTGGGLKFVESSIRSDPFLVLNGDSLVPHMDFAALAEAYRAAGHPVMIAATHIESAGRFGTMEFDDEGRLLAFREKANRDQGWVNAGIYIMAKSVLSAIAPDRPASLETDVFQDLIAAGQVHVFKARGPLLDMGTPDGIRQMEDFLSASR